MKEKKLRIDDLLGKGFDNGQNLLQIGNFLVGDEDIRGISSDLGYEFKDVTPDMLGRANQVKVDKDNTTIIDGAGDKKAIKARVASIKAQIEVTT